MFAHLPPYEGDDFISLAVFRKTFEYDSASYARPDKIEVLKFEGVPPVCTRGPDGAGDAFIGLALDEAIELAHKLGYRSSKPKIITKEGVREFAHKGE